MSFPEVDQYQIIQKKDLTLLIKIKTDKYNETILNEIKMEIKQITGLNNKISFERTKYFIRLKNGKQKVIISNVD